MNIAEKSEKIALELAEQLQNEVLNFKIGVTKSAVVFTVNVQKLTNDASKALLELRK